MAAATKKKAKAKAKPATKPKSKAKPEPKAKTSGPKRTAPAAKKKAAAPRAARPSSSARELEALNEQMAQLQGDLTAAELRSQSLALERDQARESLAAEQDGRRALEEQVSNTASIQADLEQMRSVAESAVAEKAQLESDLAAVRNELEAERARAESLAQEKESLEGQGAEATALQTELDQMRSAAESTAAEKAQLESDLAAVLNELEAERAKAESLAQEKESLEGQGAEATALQTELDQMHSAAESAAAEKAQLETDLAGVRDELEAERAKETTPPEDDMSDDDKAELARLRDEAMLFEGLRHDLGEALDKIDRLAVEKCDLEKEQANVASQLMEKTRLVETLQKRMDSMNFPAPASTSDVQLRGKPESVRTPSGAKRQSRRTAFQADQIPETPSGGRASTLRRGPAVMVAIDDERLRQGCASEIETTGMAATIIADSQEAWTGITHRDVRGLIIELEFDGGQGKQLLGRLALAKRRIPIVVICDESFPMDRLPRLPQMKVIAKPVPAHQVYQALATVMGK